MIIRNDFHNTEIHTSKRDGDTLSASTVRRWARALCGVSGCQCGGVGGVRMSDVYVDEDNSRCFGGESPRYTLVAL